MNGHRRSYAGNWFLSYVIPCGAGWAVWGVTGSMVAAVITAVVALVLFLALAGRRS